MSSCSCTAGKQNTQASKCNDLSKILRRLILVPEFDNAGAKNEIANVAGVTKSALQAKFDASDIDNRYFPLAKMENVENTRSETVYRTYNSGNKSKVEDGLRTFTGIIPFGDAILLGKIRSWGCQKLGFYGVDKSGNFRYVTDSATKTKVQPILIDENSFDVQLVEATDKEEQYIMIKFDYRRSVDDALLRTIPADELDFDALEDIYALLDANVVYTSSSVNGVVATLTDDYGLPITGLVATDLTLHNVTDNATVDKTMVETSNGVYEITYTSAQTVADVITATFVKSGYDFAKVTASTIVVA